MIGRKANRVGGREGELSVGDGLTDCKAGDGDEGGGGDQKRANRDRRREQGGGGEGRRLTAAMARQKRGKGPVVG